MVDNNTYRHIAPRATSKGRAMRQLIAVAATLALTLMAFTSAAAAHSRGCAYAHSAINAASRAQLRHAVVCLVNQQRSERALPSSWPTAVSTSPPRAGPTTMVSHRDFTHGADFASRISAVGFDWSNVGENIAAGFQTPAAVVRAWMASTGHCQNILSPIFRMVGTGVDDGASLQAQRPAPGPRTSACGWASTPPRATTARPTAAPTQLTGAGPDAAGRLRLSWPRTRAALSKGAVSRRYHSASSAAWQPEPAAVIA